MNNSDQDIEEGRHFIGITAKNLVEDRVRKFPDLECWKHNFIHSLITSRGKGAGSKTPIELEQVYLLI